MQSINNIGSGYLPALLITKKIFSSILPIIQSAREAERRSYYYNQIKQQIGLAIHN